MDNGFAEMMSQMRFFSLGIVLKDKPKTSDFIDVWPAEQHPYVDGDLSKAQGVTLKAKWMRADNTQRVTSPDVCAKESVHIYRYADTDQYFWLPGAYEPGLRKKETIVWVVSNNPDQSSPTKAPDIGNQFFIKVSSDDKTFHIHTPTNDGEKVGMDIVGDWDKGIFTYRDTKSNVIECNGETDRITVSAQKEVVIKAAEKIAALSKVVFIQCLEADVRASGKMTFITPTMELQGNLKVTGDIEGGGGINIQGVGQGSAWIP